MKHKSLTICIGCILFFLIACQPVVRAAPTGTAAAVSTSTANPTSTPIQPSVEFIGQSMYVVSKPDFYSTLNKTAMSGDKAAVLAVYREGEYVWLDLRFEDGTKGWIFTRFSDANPDVRLNTAAMSLVAAAGPNPTPTPAPLLGLPPLIVPPGDCQPTDQDQYVWSPNRLSPYAACVHVSGIVKGSIEENEGPEGDGDTVFDIAPDAPYVRYVNQFSKNGYIHVEIVCSVPTTSALAVSTCAQDTDPLQKPFPRVGEHVWLEGRLVTDDVHGLWVELHPLYRWGILK